MAKPPEIAHFSGVRMAKAISHQNIEKLSEPGVYLLGDGLRLIVTSGVRGLSKRWSVRVTLRGSAKKVEAGLGVFAPRTDHHISYREAREAARAHQIAARDGRSLAHEARASRKACDAPKPDDAPTFAQVAEDHIKRMRPAWRGSVSERQRRSSLETYAAPVIGSKRLADIGPADVETILAPIWVEKGETARRVRQRIHAVIERGRALGHWPAERVNPASPAVVAGLMPRIRTKVSHHRALAWKDAPTLFAELSERRAMAALAAQWLLLTATRTSETLLATWSELDLEQRCWRISEDRMKAGDEHVVPLASQAVAIVHALMPFKPKKGPDWLFPGERQGKPLSNMAVLQLLERMAWLESTTAHGFRSTFRDWAGENTSVRSEVIETALAHSVANKSEAAYHRSRYIEARRALMQDWADFISGAAPDVPVAPKIAQTPKGPA